MKNLNLPHHQTTPPPPPKGGQTEHMQLRRVQPLALALTQRPPARKGGASWRTGPCQILFCRFSFGRSGEMEMDVWVGGERFGGRRWVVTGRSGVDVKTFIWVFAFLRWGASGRECVEPSLGFCVTSSFSFYEPTRWMLRWISDSTGCRGMLASRQSAVVVSRFGVLQVPCFFFWSIELHTLVSDCHICRTCVQQGYLGRPQRSAQGNNRIVIEERNLFSELIRTNTHVKTEEKHSLELRHGSSLSNVCWTLLRVGAQDGWPTS